MFDWWGFRWDPHFFPCVSFVGSVDGALSDTQKRGDFVAVFPTRNQGVDALNLFDGQHGSASSPLIHDLRNRFQMLRIDARGNKTEMIYIVLFRNPAFKFAVIEPVCALSLTILAGMAVAVFVERLLPYPAGRAIASVFNRIVQGSSVVIVQVILGLSGGIPTILSSQLRDLSLATAVTHAKAGWILRLNHVAVRTAVSDAIALVLALDVSSLMGRVSRNRGDSLAPAHAEPARIGRRRGTYRLGHATMPAEELVGLTLDKTKSRHCRFCDIGFVAAAAMAVAEWNFHDSSPSRMGWRPWGSPALTSVSKADALLA